MIKLQVREKAVELYVKTKSHEDIIAEGEMMTGDGSGADGGGGEGSGGDGGSADGSASCAGSGSGSAVSRVCDAVTKPALDDRRYRGLELSNGLKAMLISDPTTDKSSASMDVGVGYLADPWELQGLAHFCEHMLFLGTAEYPEENGYQKFLQDHGGYSNAWTSSENTNY